MEVTEGKVSKEQGGFREERGCADQTFTIKRLVEEYLEKDKKLYAAFMDLKWFGHIERMGNGEFVKVYLSSVEGTNRRGRPLGRWEDRMREYVSERGVRGNVLEWTRGECMDRERWKSIWCGHSLGRHSQMEQGISAID